VRPALGAKLSVVTQGEQGVLMGDREEDDVAALSPDAAIGASAGDVGLPPEAHATTAAIAALDENLDPVDEHCGRRAPK
jgi:hypothetical protein